jgi:hypothetical protein
MGFGDIGVLRDGSCLISLEDLFAIESMKFSYFQVSTS